NYELRIILSSCTSSNPGYPDSDKIITNYELRIILSSCTSSNPGYPDSDKIITNYELRITNYSIILYIL
ncbi:hypothetical protein, partial [Cylindrospermopsis raciborskii]|uniref:hypothetical protein n=1 Tax=Cylindrospermopsis raciborskii TaxID=77022 RepID=UPI001CA56550